MIVLYKKDSGEITDFIDGEVKGLNPELASMIYNGDKTETNISEVDDTIELESMTTLSKLKVLEALDNLPEERVKFDVLMADEKFNERWEASTELELNYPLTIQALTQVNIDVDLIKREILEANNEK